jgi:anthranilate phosphoribosyltransferase
MAAAADVTAAVDPVLAPPPTMAALPTPPDAPASLAPEPTLALPVLVKLAIGTPDADPAAVTPPEVADAISQLMAGALSAAQGEALLAGLHHHGLDSRADILREASVAMRAHGASPDAGVLSALVARRGRKEGAYNGGLCDIVGTGGDRHNTFNISTTSSILASSLLLVSKHGNRASTSKSGSADVLDHMHHPRAPSLAAVSPATLPSVYEATNYAFLFASVFHPRMRFVSPIRKALPHPTIFNLLGPLASPVEACLEARMIGVRHHSLGAVFADALRIEGARKALVVCGEEELDEVSCAGRTRCWMLREAAAGSTSQDGPPAVVVDHFWVAPSDFGLGTHSLAEVASGQGPAENAEILRRILQNELADDDPILEFVLLNTAALLVVSGVCEADSSAMGPGDDGVVVAERGPGGQRWKEGVRRARWAVRSGEAWRQWQAFVDTTHRLGGL